MRASQRTLGVAMTAETAGNGSPSVLLDACSRVGIEARGAQRVQFGAGVGYRLPSGVLVRIGRLAHAGEVLREMEVSRWLAAAGLAAVRAVPGLRQPIDVHGHAVTFWLDPPPHRPADFTELAVALSRLHAAPLPTTFALGQVQPFRQLARAVDAAACFGAEDRRWLHEHLAELRGRWADLAAGNQWCVVHGEAWGREFAVTSDQRSLLLDPQHLMIGPPEWDLVPTAVEYYSLGWIDGGSYDCFCRGYGLDVTRWGGYFLLRDIREFRMTLAAARVAATADTWRAQAHQRLACIRGDDGPRRWLGWEPLPAAAR